MIKRSFYLCFKNKDKIYFSDDQTLVFLIQSL